MIDELLHDDEDLRRGALDGLARLPEDLHAALAVRLVLLARDAAEAVDRPALEKVLAALVRLRVDSVRSYLLRLADEESPELKRALLQAIRGTDTKATRAVLLHLLSDDALVLDAVEAIAAAPWPGVLPELLEIAESDDTLARAALGGIVRCAAHGPAAANAAYDFLTELLADPGLKDAARAALADLHRSEIL